MSECFIGEIRMFGGNFAPMDWAACDGQQLSISQNDVLYSLIGTTYGGDGYQSFNLPDLRGRTPIHMGTGSGLTPRSIGQAIGAEQVTVDSTTMAAHTHPLVANSTNAGAVYDPTGKVLCQSTSPGKLYTALAGTDVSMHASSVTSSGGGQAHDNMMPSLCLNFIIALNGYYPSRS
jgi:microcystin-dependent protein